jgi:hypothetical protein
VIGPILFVVGFLILGAIRPNYSPIKVFVSQLSLNGSGGWQVANFVVSGVLILAFGVGLRDVVAVGLIGSWTWIAVSVVGVGLVLLGAFKDDGWFGYPPGSPQGIGMPRSWHGWGHLSTASVTAAGIILAPLGVVVTGGGSDALWTAYSLACPFLFLGLYAVGLASSQGWVLPDRAGVFQRLSLATGLTWIAVLAVRLLA